MCATCGCGVAGVRVFGPGQLSAGGAAPGPGPETAHGDDPGPGHDHGHQHHDGHEHDDGHEHGHGPESRTVQIQQKILAKNDRLAADNRAWLAARGILAVNLMSSPGAGKTTLLERTAREAGAGLGLTVIEGDQETTLDASRIEAAGCAVAQINTGAGCHLDASMVARGLRALDPRPGSVLVIENVGNLVCPALFDLGEAARVVLSSVTEGADKPRQVPADVPRRGPGPADQGGPAALRGFRHRAARGGPQDDQPRARRSCRSRPPPARACPPGTAGSASAPASPDRAPGNFFPNGPFAPAFPQASRHVNGP